MARTAQTDLPEGATVMRHPFRKGSVLEVFSCKDNDPVVVKLMSEKHKWTRLLKRVEEGEVNSLERKKAKKARVKADHSISLSREVI